MPATFLPERVTFDRWRDGYSVAGFPDPIASITATHAGNIHCDCEGCRSLRSEWRQSPEHYGECPPHIYAHILQYGWDDGDTGGVLPGKSMNRFIHRIGVELEGAWEEEPVNVHHDGSVTAPGPYKGECRSPACASWPELSRFITDNYPDAINETCGLHVHFSFPHTGLYSRLMDKTFQGYFLKLMAGFGKKHNMPESFAHRMAGKNRYCRRDWHPDQQARGDISVRYCHWNFCHAQHGTAECRMLPMLDTPARAVKAIQAVKLSVILFLRKQPLEEAGVLMEESLAELEKMAKAGRSTPNIQREEY